MLEHLPSALIPSPPHSASPGVDTPEPAATRFLLCPWMLRLQVVDVEGRAGNGRNGKRYRLDPACGG